MANIHSKKKCSFCKITKPLSEFYKRGENRYRSHCKKCFSDRRDFRLKSLVVVVPKSKLCSSCGEDKPSSEFHSNKTVRDGLSAICSECKREYDSSKSSIRSRDVPSNTYEYRRSWRLKNRNLKRFYTAKRRALIKNATPSWADMGSIRSVYKECPEGYEVDHIIPIVSDIVCGLHVHTNLQYLTKKENAAKGNKHEI